MTAASDALLLDPALSASTSPAPMTLERLVAERGLAPSETLARARLVRDETGERLESVLTRLGLVSEQALAEAVARASRLRMVRAEDFPTEPPALPLPVRFLRDVKAAPLAVTAQGCEIAVVDPLDPYIISALAYALERPVLAVVARAGDIEAALDRWYGALATHADAEGDGTADEADLERLKDLASDAPVVRAVNGLIARAAEARASDIHVEPTEDALKVRFRIDGALQDQERLPGALKAAFVSRVKVMAGLNIAERRLPQDGRLRLAVRGHDIDLRIATSPTIHGESVVMRLLDRSNLALDFDSLGFDAPTLKRYQDILSLPHGILLVTGPTGSGKTTTLYASLASLNAPERKILTIEDPIEYRLAGINQTQVAPGIGLTFAAALRSFLRQDPDVMMVGEIRDLETAQVAVQAALTGHAILSTLHTNSAAAAVTRLLDMGVEPFLITSTLNAVLAQRLVRRLCQTCAEPYEPTAEAIETLGLREIDGAPIRLFHPVGCAACDGSGYRGRIALLELLTVDDEVARLVLAHGEAREIQRAGIAAGMRPMLEDGMLKAQTGLTTVEEVLRVTRED